jgi:hypothetical protein
MVPLNISDVVQLAQKLGCKITHLPITNLGVLHFKKVDRRTLKFFNWEKKEKISRLERQIAFHLWSTYIVKLCYFIYTPILEVYL